MSDSLASIQRRKRHVRTLRLARKIHRTTGALLFALFFVVGSTGLLLGWKKHSGGYILPKTYEGSSTNMAEWLPVEVLHQNAIRIAREKISPDLSLDLERIDIRPDKGMAKFVFIEGDWGVQLDCATGELLHIERRRSDLIENIHDGSILDYFFGASYEQIKLVDHGQRAPHLHRDRFLALVRREAFPEVARRALTGTFAPIINSACWGPALGVSSSGNGGS